MKNLNTVFRTEKHVSGFLLRLILGIVILPHGCQLLLGSFGGFGFNGSMNYFTNTVGLPWIIGFMVIMLQFFGAIFILAGIASRLFAFATIALFAGMIITTHLDHGFFMNWSGNKQGEGFEYHILVIGLALLLLINGSGRFSLDFLLTRRYLHLSKLQGA